MPRLGQIAANFQRRVKIEESCEKALPKGDEDQSERKPLVSLYLGKERNGCKRGGKKGIKIRNRRPEGTRSTRQNEQKESRDCDHRSHGLHSDPGRTQTRSRRKERQGHWILVSSAEMISETGPIRPFGYYSSDCPRAQLKHHCGTTTSCTASLCFKQREQTSALPGIPRSAEAVSMNT